MISGIDIHAPIEPGIGVGQIKLLGSMFDLRVFILSSIDVIDPDTNRHGEWECYFSFPDWLVFSYKGIIDVVANVYTGLITSIRLKEGFKGSLWGRIRVGSFVRELVELQPDIGFDDDVIFVGDDYNLGFTVDDGKSIDDIADVLDDRITMIEICDWSLAIPLGETRFPTIWKDEMSALLRRI